MRRSLICLLLLVALVVSGVASGAASARPVPHRAIAALSTRPASFDKTKFVFDLGTAAFAIHHFIYEPYQATHLKGFKAKAKAALAALFAYNRLEAAYNVAQNGNSQLLHKLVAPLNALINAAKSLGSSLRHGITSGVSGADSDLSSLASAAAKAGTPFKDIATSI